MKNIQCKTIKKLYLNSLIKCILIAKYTDCSTSISIFLRPIFCKVKILLKILGKNFSKNH